MNTVTQFLADRNSQAIGMVVVICPSVSLSVCPFVTDVLWLSCRAYPKTFEGCYTLLRLNTVRYGLDCY